MKKTAFIFILFLLFFIGFNAFTETLTGPEILEKVDRVMNAPKDREMESRMILIDKAGNKKERTVQMYQKGMDKRLSRFLTPADQRGISVLSLPGDKIYLYLPAFKKTKRIASHIKNNKFAGTDFSYEDMEAKQYSDHYTATLLGSDSGTYVLELIPKDKASEYAKLQMRVDRDNFLALEVEYYNRKGVLQKRLKNSGIEQIDGYWIARENEMHDIIKNHRTRIVLNNIKFDTGLSDDIFTTRYLAR